MKLADLNQNTMKLGISRPNLNPDAPTGGVGGSTELTRPLQKAKTGVDKDEEGKLEGNPLNNIAREADQLVGSTVPMPFKNTPNVNKPPNLSNI